MMERGPTLQVCPGVFDQAGAQEVFSQQQLCSWKLNSWGDLGKHDTRMGTYSSKAVFIHLPRLIA